jgi:hypothetical protein
VYHPAPAQFFNKTHKKRFVRKVKKTIDWLCFESISEITPVIKRTSEAITRTADR